MTKPICQSCGQSIPKATPHTWTLEWPASKLAKSRHRKRGKLQIVTKHREFAEPLLAAGWVEARNL